VAVDIVLLGPPGAGKGTQAQRVASSLGLAHLSTGEIFRGHIADKTAIGLEVKALLDRGQLAPDELTCHMVEEWVGREASQAGCVFDGFPRSESQARTLDEMLSRYGRTVTMAIHIEVSDDEVVGRLAARRTCPLCGRIYNLRFDPPKREGLCDNPDCDGQPLVHREDDREEVIRERLQVYHRNDDPILRYYAAQGKLRVIEAEGLPFEGVFEKIESLLTATGLERAS
jgi:adenylate kinase